MLQYAIARSTVHSKLCTNPGVLLYTVVQPTTNLQNADSMASFLLPHDDKDVIRIKLNDHIEVDIKFEVVFYLLATTATILQYLFILATSELTSITVSAADAQG